MFPDEVIFNILLNATIDTIINLQLNKKFASIIKNKYIWKNIYDKKNIYGIEYTMNEYKLLSKNFKIISFDLMDENIFYLMSKESMNEIGHIDNIIKQKILIKYPNRIMLRILAKTSITTINDCISRYDISKLMCLYPYQIN